MFFPQFDFVRWKKLISGSKWKRFQSVSESNKYQNDMQTFLFWKRLKNASNFLNSSYRGALI